MKEWIKKEITSVRLRVVRKEVAQTHTNASECVAIKKSSSNVSEREREEGDGGGAEVGVLLARL